MDGASGTVCQPHSHNGQCGVPPTGRPETSIQVACCPPDTTRVVAPGTFDGLGHWAFLVLPRVAGTVLDKGRLALFRHDVVELGVDSLVYRGPRHASGPDIIQVQTHAIFEIVPRIQHEGMPYHEYICAESQSIDEVDAATP